VGGQQVLPGARNPEDPCQACIPATSTSGYSVITQAGISCDDGVFCNGPGVCDQGVCVPQGAPCSGTVPFCVELAAACVCVGDSCNDGLFCNGTESCLAAGTCQSGTPPPCADPTPYCSDDAGRCVPCLAHEHCEAPNPWCVNHRCVACDTCLCPQGEHDDGTGTCAPLGTCAQGFRRVYLDADWDGAGTGDLLEPCFQGLLPDGYADTATDCDDENPDAWRGLVLWPDQDQDGITGTGAGACVGETLPAGYLEASQPGAAVSFQPASAVNLSAAFNPDWQNPGRATLPDGLYARAGGVDSGKPSDDLLVSGFHLQVPADATVTGVAVHVLRRKSASGSGVAVDASVRLARGGVAVSADRSHADPWPSAAFETANYGGPGDLWGTTWTPEDVTDPGFGVVLRGKGQTSTNVDLYVDHVWVEVFHSLGPPDCDDLDPTVVSPWWAAPDQDGDLFPTGTPAWLCPRPFPGTDYREYGAVDCYDLNPAAFPDQAGAFGVQRGDGSFDYDCDGVEETVNLVRHLACTGNATSCAPSSTTAVTPTGGCGETMSVPRCTTANSCTSPVSTPLPIPCR
jgi:hypothetical protein